MATAALWLEKLGTPPPDVCLDWSMQLQNRFNQTHHAIQGSSSTPLSWNDLEVSDTALLSVTVDREHYSVQELIDQLVSWSRSESEQVVELPRAAFGTLASKNRQCSVETQQSTSTLLTFVKQHRFAAIAVGTLCLVCLGWMASQLISSPQAKSAQITRSQPTEHTQANPTPTDANAVSEEDLAVATMDQPPSLEDVLGNPSETVDRPSLELPSMNLSSALLSSESLATTDSNELKNNSTESTDSPRLETEGNGTEPQSNAKLEVDGDVMRDVAALVESAESRASESDLHSATNDDEPRTNFEAIVLKTSPMLQTHLLPSKVAKPREPVWSISIAVDDEFTVQPMEAQRVTDRQAATWLIGNVDAKSPTTKIAIQARVAPGKKVGLQWRIAAVSDEVPGLLLPVAKELQIFQQRLLSYIELTRRESDQLSVMSRSADKEIRSVISKQRAALDAQNKLASRIAAIADNAGILDDLLRSQVTLHVDLYEGDKPNAQRLLRYGDPEQRKVRESAE